jgi:hypothetical protein
MNMRREIVKCSEFRANATYLRGMTAHQTLGDIEARLLDRGFRLQISSAARDSQLRRDRRGAF